MSSDLESDDFAVQPRVKRFKFESDASKLKSIHLPSTLSSSQKQYTFYDTLQHHHQLTLSPTFIQFSSSVSDASATLPLLLHNWKLVSDAWIQSLQQTREDPEGLEPMLTSLGALLGDLRETLAPSYSSIYECLLDTFAHKSTPPEVLPSLLHTLRSVWKYLLVPSSTTVDVEKTWLILAARIPRLNYELKRMLGETYGSILRLFKGEVRQHAIILLMKDDESEHEDCIAWMLVEACKSVNGTIHPAVTSVLSTAIRNMHYTQRSDKLIRRCMTALIHHSSSDVEFAPVIEILLQFFRETIKEKNDPEVALRVLAVVTGTRRGSRIAHQYMEQICQIILDSPAVVMQPATLTLTVPLLCALPLSQTSIARRLFLRFLSAELVGTLSDISYHGWDMIVAPILRQTIMKLLRQKAETESDEVTRWMRLLATISREKSVPLELGDIEIDVRRYCERKLQNFRNETWSAVAVNEMVALMPLLPSEISPLLLVPIISNLLTVDPQQPQDADRAKLLSFLISALSRLLPDHDEIMADPNWIDTILLHWTWSENVMEAVADFLAIVPNKHRISSEKLTILLQSLSSHSHMIRMSTLKILRHHLKSSAVDYCLTAESIPLTLQSVKERVLRISQVPLSLNTQDSQTQEALEVNIATRWLIGQLKVNLMPVWKPTMQAIDVISKLVQGPSGRDLVWSVIFAELRESLVTVPRQTLHSTRKAKLGQPEEQEYTWRDPSAFKIRIALAKWVEGHAPRVEDASSLERLDLDSYSTRIIGLLTTCHTMSEQYNRNLIPYFLAMPLPLTVSRSISWLSLFVKFSNPQTLVNKEEMYTYFISLLSHPDRVLQRLALQCVLGYSTKNKQLLAGGWKDRLEALLDESRFRETLTLLSNTFSDLQSDERHEVVPILIRIMYGMMLDRRGKNSDRSKGRAQAILGFMGSECTSTELALLVDLMLSPFDLSSRSLGLEGGLNLNYLQAASVRQRTGFLTLLGDVLKNIGHTLVNVWPSLLTTVIALTADSQIQCGVSDNPPRKSPQGGEVSDYESDAEDAHVPHSLHATQRAIRKLGFKRLVQFFRIENSFDYAPYIPTCFRSLISPRLAVFDSENISAPTGLLELFVTWGSHPKYIRFLVDFDTRVLPEIYGCLLTRNVHSSVVLRVFDLVERMHSLGAEDPTILTDIIKPHVSVLLSNISVLVGRSQSTSNLGTAFFQRQLSILSHIATYLSNSTEAVTLLKLFTPLLRQPVKMINERTKTDILDITANLLHLIPDIKDWQNQLYIETYDIISRQFRTMKSRQGRNATVNAFHALAEFHPDLQPLDRLLASLNSFSVKRIDEPDFDQRLSAYAELEANIAKSLKPQQWVPFIHNSLAHVQDSDEHAIRVGSATILKCFITVAASSADLNYDLLFRKLLYPALCHGLRSKNESVRSEILDVIAHAVSNGPSMLVMQDLQILRAQGDEEADFFNNILHVQIHRRSRAIRRLGDFCDQGHLRSSTVSDVIIPLIIHNIRLPTSLNHHLVNETVSTMGKLAMRLNWGPYHTLVRKFLKLSRKHDEVERVYIRTLVAVLENFHFRMDEMTDECVEHSSGNDEPISSVIGGEYQSQNQTNSVKILDTVHLRLLPSLLRALETQGETEASLRIPVAIGIVKVAQHLPEPMRSLHTTRLVTILCQILRSKSQETRDLTRESLCRIASVIGPGSLHSIIKELRMALLRGPQLHILAYVSHALLNQFIPETVILKNGDMDLCVNDIAHISSEVIFGQSGKDVQHEDFKTKMREVGQAASRGLDCFYIMAKHITPSRISSLLAPIRAILHQTQSFKLVNQVDEVLKRVADGLNSNTHLNSSEILVLCHTLLSQNAKFLRETVDTKRKLPGKVTRDIEVQPHRKSSVDHDQFPNNSYRFVVFGLDLLITAFRRNRFDFADPDTLSKLDPMVNLLGNALYSNHEPVVVAAMKASSMIIKSRTKALDAAIPVIVGQILNIIRQTGSSESDTVQTGFKSLATILRECQTAKVKEQDLLFLIKMVTPDLEEPARQAAVFPLLRAIVSRKFVVPEIYDLMARISEIMVVNQAKQVQELCRSLLLQFLLDYPQGKGRLRNQMIFLAQNLSYIHESGRRSVMEFLGAVLTKFEVSLIHEYSDLIFVPLVMVIANDDSTICRGMASELVKTLFARLDLEQRQILISHLHTWASQSDRQQLARVAVQIYGVIIEASALEIKPFAAIILADINTILLNSQATLQKAEQEDGAGELMAPSWEIPYHALHSMSNFLRIFPERTVQNDSVRWEAVAGHLLFPHAWVRTAASRLIGSLFAMVPFNSPLGGQSGIFIFTPQGMREMAQTHTMQLKGEHLDDSLGLQIVKNLVYIGKSFSILSKDESASSQVTHVLNVDKKALCNGAEYEIPLPWLFSKLSYQVKSAHIARRNRSDQRANWAQQPLCVLRWFAAMTAFLEPEQVEQYLIHMLTPIYRITQDDTIRDLQFDELKAFAVELQDMIQAKVGSTIFVEIFTRIRSAVLNIRNERKTARVLQVATNPQLTAKRRIQKNLIKKESRKRKSLKQAALRGHIKRETRTE